MTYLLAVVIGVLYATGFYLMMRRSIVKLLIGLVLLGHATNLFLFTIGGVVRGQPPLIGLEQVSLASPFADPLPQALILTALVIGFGVQAFALTLFKRAYQTIGTDDLDALRVSDDPVSTGG